MSIKQSLALVCIVISALFIAQDMLEEYLLTQSKLPRCVPSQVKSSYTLKRLV